PQPFMSWLARLLPHVEMQALWTQTTDAYAKDRDFLHSPPHVGLATPVRLFGCPSDSRTSEFGMTEDKRAVAFTSYLGVEGRNQFSLDGVLFLDSRIRFGDISDGTSSTLMVGERPPSGSFALGWLYAGWGQSKDGSGDMVLSVREKNVSIYGRGC